MMWNTCAYSTHGRMTVLIIVYILQGTRWKPCHEANTVSNEFVLWLGTVDNVLSHNLAMEISGEYARNNQWRWKVWFVFYQYPYTWPLKWNHYSDVIMVASQITGVLIVYSIVCSGANQRKHQGYASMASAGSSPVTGEFPTQRRSI